MFEAMSGRRGQGSKLIEAPPVAVPDEHAELVEADQRFQAALQVAIAAGAASRARKPGCARDGSPVGRPERLSPTMSVHRRESRGRRARDSPRKTLDEG